MSSFNTLKLNEHSCPHCGHLQNWTIQFKFGDCWQHEYSLFDELRWNGNDIGVQAASIVLVEGINENTCRNCLIEEVYARIFVDDNKLVAVSLVEKNILFPMDSDGDYIVINE